MHLICPACNTGYEVPAESILPQGRSVKCATCDHTWLARPAIMPAAPPAATPSPRRAGASFARPARSSHGSAALAALFDNEEAAPTYHGAADAGLAKSKPAPPKFNRAGFDAQVEDMLGMPEIARLLQQAEDGPEQGDGPVPSASRDKSAPTPGPFRQVMRGFVDAFTGLVAVADNALEALLVRGQGEAEPVRTPGDRKVTEWRLEQLRRARRRMTPAKLAGWSLFYATLGAMVWGGVFLREEIAGHWPQAGAAYDRFGLINPAEPLEVSSISHRFARSPQGNVVELAGLVGNRGDTAVPAPLIRADALGGDGSVLSSWAFTLDDVRMVTPATEIPFRSRALTPDGTVSVRVAILNARERAELERAVPGIAASIEAATAPGTSSTTFFMRKTTSGWGAGDEPQPIGNGLRD